MKPCFIIVNEVDAGPVGIPVHAIQRFAPEGKDPRAGPTEIETDSHEFIVKESFLKVAEYIKDACNDKGPP